jgi:hypothetical protein
MIIAKDLSTQGQLLQFSENAFLGLNPFLHISHRFFWINCSIPEDLKPLRYTRLKRPKLHCAPDANNRLLLAPFALLWSDC